MADAAPHTPSGVLSRRQLAQRAGGALLSTSALASLLAACGDDSEQPSAQSAKSDIGGALSIYVWEGYYKPEAAAPFVDKYGVSVKVSTISNSEEIFTTLKAGGTSRLNLCTPNVGQAVQLAPAGLLQPLDLERVPNRRDYLPQIQQVAEQSAVGGKHYTAPFVWGMNACIYDSSVFAKAPESWMDLTKPAYAKRLGLVDSALDNYATWAPVLGYDEPYALTPAELDDVTNFLIKFKRTQVRTFGSSLDDFADQFARGDIVALGTQQWIYQADLAVSKGAKTVKWHLPKQGGGLIWTDGWAIPSDADNVDTAYAFMNHMIGVEAQVITAPALFSGTVNAKAVSRLPRKARDTYPYEGDAAIQERTRLAAFPTGENGKATYQDYIRAWGRVQAA